MSDMSETSDTGNSAGRIERPGVPVVPTSIRMSRGTREALNFIRHTLNKCRAKGEPAWSLGEVIELSIDQAYEPWREIRRAVQANPKLRAVSPRRRRRPAQGAELNHAPAA